MDISLNKCQDTLTTSFYTVQSYHSGYGYSPSKVASSTGWLRNPNPSHYRNGLVWKNQQCLDKYETLVGKKYKEPVDGKFEDATDCILQRLKEPEDCGDDLDIIVCF